MEMSYKNIFMYGTAKRGFVACAAFVLSVAFWATATPVIRDIGLDANKNKGQVNGWIGIEGENFDGTTTSVLFAKSGGGNGGLSKCLRLQGPGDNPLPSPGDRGDRQHVRRGGLRKLGRLPA
jgi:hypothetical protein